MYYFVCTCLSLNLLSEIKTLQTKSAIWYTSILSLKTYLISSYVVIQQFYRKEVVRVYATVVEHVRLAKVIIFKKKKRKGYKKKKGTTNYNIHSRS